MAGLKPTNQLVYPTARMDLKLALAPCNPNVFPSPHPTPAAGAYDPRSTHLPPSRDSHDCLCGDPRPQVA